MTEELRLRLLGKPEVTRGGRPVTGFAYHKGLALLCYLAVTGRSHSRETLAGLLWGEVPEANARANLRKALSSLRQLVAPHLVISRREVAFDRESGCWLDVEAFSQRVSEAAGQSGDSSTPQPVASLTEAIALYRGDFLEGFYVHDAPAFEEWALGQREWLKELVLQALHLLVAHHTTSGEYAVALAHVNRLLALDPWREEAHWQKMLLLALSGRRSDALAQYETCRRILAEELGVKPAAETTALYNQILAGEIESLQTPRVIRHNLPVQPTPFVGRGEELAQVARYLADPACRLVTLVGLGGIGKTRLALQAAAQHIEAVPDGVYFVPLAFVSEAKLLAAAISEAIGVSVRDSGTPSEVLNERLLNYLIGKKMLLVLDNFEHLLDGTPLVTEIIHRAPGVKLLATSRQRLSLHGEWVFDLPGLEVPPSDETGDPQDYSAVQLFLQSARRMRADFTLAAEEIPSVIRICQLVEGLPLAIELAATWVRVLSCEEIAREIEQSLPFLTTSLRDVPGRHRSLQAAFEQSWQRLPEAERNALRRLSVFRGGFGRAAAKQVAGASLTMLASLVDKSFLRRVSAARYDLHELLRQYAEEKLKAIPKEKAQVHDLHCIYFTAFLQEREDDLEGKRQKAALEEIAAEIENIRVAWRWAIAQGKTTKEVRESMESLFLFYETRGWFQEGQEGKDGKELRALVEAIVAQKQGL